MNGVEGQEKSLIESQGISLYELKWIPGLWINVNTDDVEARSAVTGTGPSCAAEKI